jgi:HEPN domain-containing protein
MNPRAKGRIPGSPSEWLSHARSDLRLAGLAISDEQVRREQLCFHAQQAGEKAIKAVLLAKAIEFPLTHDMEQLLEIAESHGMTLPADVRQAGILSPYAVEARYPGCWFEVTQTDVEEALRTAEACVEWAETELSRPQESQS